MLELQLTDEEVEQKRKRKRMERFIKGINLKVDREGYSSGFFAEVRNVGTRW